MPQLKEYTVFISHSWDYDNHYMRLVEMLNEAKLFNVAYEEATKSNPINSQNAQYIKVTLSKKISNSNIVLGLAGMYASYSDWMKWELEKAVQLGIPIVGIIPWGQERVSNIVSEKAKELVRWNTDPIISAIRRNAL
jgi:hypothetical protein